MLTLIQLTLRSLLKARQTSLFVLLAILLLALSGLASELSARQPQVTTLDLGLSFLQFLLPIMAIFFGYSQFANELDQKGGSSLLLAMPIARHQFVLARFISLAIAMGLLLITLGLLLAAVCYFVGLGYEQSTGIALGVPYTIALLGIWLETIVVLAIVFAFSTLGSSSSFCLFASLSYWWVARSVSATRGLLENAPTLLESGKSFQLILSKAQWFFPDLLALDWRAPSLYAGHLSLLQEISWYNIASNGVFISLALSFAIYRFRRLELA